MATIEEESNIHQKVISPHRMPKQAKDILTAIAGKGFIAGGYARDILLNTHTSTDIDIFFHEGVNRRVSIEPEEAGEGPRGPLTKWIPFGPIIDDLRDLGYEFTRALPNAWEFIMPRRDGKHDKNFRKVQVIQPFENRWMRTFGSVSQVIGQFDFTVVMAAIQKQHPANGSVELKSYIAYEHEDFRKDTKRKRLIIQHINCPIAVSMRVNKYCAKGFYIGPKEIIKLFKEWDSREQSYKDRLIQLADRDNLDPQEWWEIEKLLRID